MSELKVLTTYEPLEYSPEVLKEARETNGGKLIMKGVIQRADVLNQNGRIYGKAILSREVRNYQKFITENRALGELDHPDDSVVSLKNVSHVMREVTMDESTGVVYGVLEVLNTPSGKIMQSLVESGIRLGISSRGVGSTQKKGDYTYVSEDFQIICFDIVSEPSTSAAFLFTEGKTVTSSELKSLFNRSDRINRILTDILSK